MCVSRAGCEYCKGDYYECYGVAAKGFVNRVNVCIL